MRLGFQEILVLLACVGIPFLALAVVLLLVMNKPGSGKPQGPKPD